MSAIRSARLPAVTPNGLRRVGRADPSAVPDPFSPWSIHRPLGQRFCQAPIRSLACARIRSESASSIARLGIASIESPAPPASGARRPLSPEASRHSRYALISISSGNAPASTRLPQSSGCTTSASRASSPSRPAWRARARTESDAIGPACFTASDSNPPPESRAAIFWRRTASSRSSRAFPRLRLAVSAARSSGVSR